VVEACTYSYHHGTTPWYRSAWTSNAKLDWCFENRNQNHTTTTRGAAVLALSEEAARGGLARLAGHKRGGSLRRKANYSRTAAMGNGASVSDEGEAGAATKQDPSHVSSASTSAAFVRQTGSGATVTTATTNPQQIRAKPKRDPTAVALDDDEEDGVSREVTRGSGSSSRWTARFLRVCGVRVTW
jgi:hypothetical protein